jgi:hypothetical protein
MAVLAALGACGDDNAAPAGGPSTSTSAAAAATAPTSGADAGTSDPSPSTPGGPSTKAAVDMGSAICSTLSTEGTLVQDLLGAPATFEITPEGSCVWEVTDPGDGPEAFAVVTSTTELYGAIIDEERGRPSFTPVEGLGDEAFTVSGWTSPVGGGMTGSTLYVLKDGTVTTFSVAGVKDGVTDQLRAIATQALG